MREHPELADAAKRALARGDLTRLLPGTYVASHQADDLLTQACAVAAWCPDAVLLGEAAAALTYWPRRAVTVLEIAAERRSRATGFWIRRVRIPPELVLTHGPLRIAAPALSAIDLADRTEGDSIDEFLRVRAGTPSHLQRALELTPSRPGNHRRRQFLLASRAEPWSAAERLAHRLLREAGIVGWQANLRIELEGGTRYLDIAIADLQLAIEIDGSRHWTDPQTAIDDRRRQNLVVLDGWLVLRFTWWDLVDRPATFVTQVRTAIRLKRSARWPGQARRARIRR